MMQSSVRSLSDPNTYVPSAAVLPTQLRIPVPNYNVPLDNGYLVHFYLTALIPKGRILCITVEKTY